MNPGDGGWCRPCSWLSKWGGTDYRMRSPACDGTSGECAAVAYEKEMAKFCQRYEDMEQPRGIIRQCSICMTDLGAGWICKKCAQTHGVEGVHYKKWPRYLRALRDDEAAARRFEKRHPRPSIESYPIYRGEII